MIYEEVTTGSRTRRTLTGAIPGALESYLALRGINFAAIQVRLSQISVSWIIVGVVVSLVQTLISARCCS